ncbi:MAG: hypothetical protein LBB56_03215 [Chitinispirillales bacterium]|jgi:hypothetical protein|nr:hypothetical protein [Chitinispirillales bacterium]
MNETVNPAKAGGAAVSSANKINISIKGRQIELDVPPEIGGVAAQHTSIGGKFDVMSFLMRFIVLAPLAIIVLALFFAISEVTGIIFTIVCILFVLLLFFKKETIGIIGTQGFVMYKFPKRTQSITSGNVYLFKDASELAFPKIIHYLNGVYTETTFKFCLSNGKNNVYKQSGQYRNLKEKEGKFGWKYPLLCDIENAWTNFLMIDLIQRLKTQGFIQFNSKKHLTKNQIEIGNDYLKCGDKKFNKDEIKGFSFSQGILYIDHINYESKLLGLKTKGDRIKIPVNGMLNRKAFLILLEHLTSEK